MNYMRLLNALMADAECEILQSEFQYFVFKRRNVLFQIAPTGYSELEIKLVATKQEERGQGKFNEGFKWFLGLLNKYEVTATATASLATITNDECFEKAYWDSRTDTLYQLHDYVTPNILLPNYKYLDDVSWCMKLVKKYGFYITDEEVLEIKRNPGGTLTRSPLLTPKERKQREQLRRKKLKIKS